MARSDFGLGVLVGGLAGLAIGYLTLRTRSQPDEDFSAPDTIDLTPAMHRRDAAAAAAEPVEALE